MGTRFPELFKSSCPEKPDEKEIPDAMLAFVATGVRRASDISLSVFSKTGPDYTLTDSCFTLRLVLWTI